MLTTQSYLCVRQLPFHFFLAAATLLPRCTLPITMDLETPRVEHQDTPEGARLVALGAWTAADLTGKASWDQLTAQLQALPAGASTAPAATHWDLRQLGKLDYLGAQVLWTHWGQAWPAQLDTEPDQRAMLETVASFTCSPPKAPQAAWSAPILVLGGRLLALLGHARGLVILIGQLLLDILRLFRRPQQGPWRDLSGHLFHMGATALPITALVGFLIGIVLSYLSARQLQQFGADVFIVDLLGVAVIRELGPVLAAILVAGRSGSAMTASLGVMRVTEELDALTVMGIPHGFRLIMPKVLALAIAMPLLILWTDAVSLFGGMIAAKIQMDLSISYFFGALPNAVKIANLWIGLGKGVVFGILIALVSCHFGLRIEPNTESLGQGTTSSVVTSITVVIIADAIFAIAFSNVGV